MLIQLNVSPVERFGCPPDQADRLAETLRGQPGLRFEGVMAIGPLTDDRDTILRAFELAKSGQCATVEKIRKKLSAEGLSAEQIVGKTLHKQLRELIEAAKKG